MKIIYFNKILLRKMSLAISAAFLLNIFFMNLAWGEVCLRPLAAGEQKKGVVNALFQLVGARFTQNQSKRQPVKLGGDWYELVTVPPGTEFVLTVSETGPAVNKMKPRRLWGVHMGRYEKILLFMQDLLQKKAEGKPLDDILLKAADNQLCRMLAASLGAMEVIRTTREWREALRQIPASELQRVDEIVNGFFDAEELEAIRGTLKDSDAITDEGLRGVWETTRFLILRLLKDRLFLNQGSKAFMRGEERWKTQEVRDHFIPVPLYMASSIIPRSPINALLIEDETQQILDLFDSADFNRQRVRPRKGEPWGKDAKLILVHLEGKSYYYLVSRKPHRPAVLIGEEFNPAYAGTMLSNEISDGGASISGVAATPFFIFSSAIPKGKDQDFQNLVRTLPGYEGTKFYTFPAGFITFKYNELFLMDTSHLDAVVGFIPKRFTDYGEDLLLVDPRYYEEVKSNNDFIAFCREQKIRVVLIPINETHFNPTNFTQSPEDMLFFNYCPDTIHALRLKPGMYKMIPREESAIRAAVALEGSFGCLVGQEANYSKPITGARLRKLVYELVPRSASDQLREAIYQEAIGRRHPFLREIDVENFVRWNYDNAGLKRGEPARLNSFLSDV